MNIESDGFYFSFVLNLAKKLSGETSSLLCVQDFSGYLEGKILPRLELCHFRNQIIDALVLPRTSSHPTSLHHSDRVAHCFI